MMKCLTCDNQIPDDGEMICSDCEIAFWKDPQAVMEYFHFCGVPATLEQIKVMLCQG